MTNNQPLTLTVEQAAQVLGIGRSTAYELVRSGDLKHIRLRRRIVVPVAHIAERLGVDREAVWDVFSAPSAPEQPDPPRVVQPRRSVARRAETPTVESATLF
jgi:excisionase family DNA binding protein